MKRRYCIANLVYGMQAPYTNLWLENQLKSLADQTNLPELRRQGWEVEYALFTDEETLPAISRHPNFMVLSQLCTIQVIKVGWPPDADRFATRYHILAQMLSQAIAHGLDSHADALSVWVADLVFAKGALPKILSHMDRGHDAVFMVPIRSAADAVMPLLTQIAGAPTDLELFEMAYRNLHHLWVASLWDSPLFSKFPYSMLWRSEAGLLAHNFGITPIAFKPNEAMRTVQSGIDSDLPAMCKNPYWCTDWTDAPVAGVEPLSNGHYPPFLLHRASIERVCDWALHAANGGPAIHPAQVGFLDKPLYYPNKARFNEPDLAERAKDIALRIQTCLRQAGGK